MLNTFEIITIGAVFIVLIVTGGIVCYHDKGNPTACASACGNIGMKSFDLATGKCECGK